MTATGSDVFYGELSGDRCAGFTLWRVATRRRIRIRNACERASGCDTGVATAGGRVLFLCWHGNAPARYRIYTASADRPSAAVVATTTVPSVANARDEPAVIGRAGGADLPFALGARVVDLDVRGRRRWSWTAPAFVYGASRARGRVSALTALAPDRVAVVVDYFDQALLRDRHDLFVVAGGTTISHRGDVPAPRPDVLGTFHGVRVYARGAWIRARRLADGHDVRLLPGGALAALSSSGLASASADRVAWLPWGAIARKLGG